MERADISIRNSIATTSHRVFMKEGHMDILERFAKGFVQGFVLQSLWLHINRNKGNNNPSIRSTDKNNIDREVMKSDK